MKTLSITASVLLIAVGSTYGAKIKSVALDLVNQGTFIDPERDGTFEFLWVSPLDVGARPGLPAVRAGITFDFTPLHKVNKGMKIESAELSLYFDDVSTNVEVHGFTGNTNAVDVEFDNLIAAFRPNQAAPFTLDVIDFIRDSVASDPNFLGFSLRMPTDLDPTANASVRFESPVLTVEGTGPIKSVPEPSGLAMLAIVLMGFATRIKTRRRLSG